MKAHLGALNMDLDVLANTNVQEHYPVVVKKPSVNLPLTELRKSGTLPLEYLRLYVKIQCHFEDISIGTDGSKDHDCVATAAVFRRLKFGFLIRARFSQRNPEHSVSHWSALRTTQTMLSRYSFSCMQAVAGLKMDHPFVAKFISKMDQLETD